MKLDLISTIEGSLLQGFFPEGWNLERMNTLAGRDPATITDREAWWSDEFEPIPCDDLNELEVRMGFELAAAIMDARTDRVPLALILPVGPMGMYRWTVLALRRWDVSCDHVWGFNMDEWSNAEGVTLEGHQPGSFQNAMEEAFYGPLGPLTVPEKQRFFATRELLPRYADEIARIRAERGRLVVVYGIGRALHIAFWEPHFAAEFPGEPEWRRETHRLGAKLHPLTIEQNAITSFKSRTTLVPAFANTIGPGLFLAADLAIGGADGALGRGMQWQGFSLWSALHHEPDPWIPASFMPTLPGRLFFARELAGPLEPECH